MNSLKGYRKINKFLTDWCNNHGFKVKCRLASEFQYEDESKTIYYALTILQMHDQLFEAICKPYLTNIEKCDNFILSFFHELGHYMLDSTYLDEDWIEYYDLLVKLEKDKLTKKDYIKYYTCPIELNATQWSCNFINDNVSLIEQFWKDLQPLILEFYRINKIEEN